MKRPKALGKSESGQMLMLDSHRQRCSRANTAHLKVEEPGARQELRHENVVELSLAQGATAKALK